MPAVAIAYDYDELDDSDNIAPVQKNNNSDLTLISSLKNHHTVTTFSPNHPSKSTITSIRKVSSSGGSGGTGSGGGRHKCPKCGMNVTFKHGDL